MSSGSHPVGAPQTVREVTRDLMRELGMTTVFGNPGSTEVGFLADWPADFRYVLGLQESVVVAMADAFAQFTGNAAMVSLHSAGGLGHGLGSMVTAYKNRSPLVVIAGQQTRSLLPGDPFLGASHAAAFPWPYVKWSCEPARAADVPAALARAYHVATQPPFGPTFVSVPADDWDEPAAPIATRPRVAGFAPDPKALTELVDALAASARPAFVLGAAVDADAAVEPVIALAERTRSAVWAAPMSARASFPEDHELFAGFLPPARKNLAAALAPYDLVVVLGAPAFTYHVPTEDGGPALPPLYLISDDEQELARAAHGVGIRSTPRLAAEQLLAAVRPSDRPVPPVRPQPPTPQPGTPMSAKYVLHAIAESLPHNGIVVEEAPSHRNDLHEYLPIRTRGRGFLTMASGVLGYGLPAALGVAIADPTRPVLAVLGDGATMYSVQALWTAVREGLPVTVVILDNGQYAAVHALAEASGAGKVPGAELGGLDFVALAQGMGAQGRFVEQPDELVEALRFSLVADRPTVLHVKVDPDVQPLY